jgi:hypothetical protein
MKITDLFKILSEEEKIELRSLIRNDEKFKHTIDFALSSYGFSISSRLYDLLIRLRLEGFHYLDMIKDSDVLKIPKIGKRTLMEFIKFREYLIQKY